MKHTIIVPNRYSDIIRPFLESHLRYEKNTEVVIIADGHRNSYGHLMIPYPFPDFQYAKAVNLGIRWSLENRPGNNIILMNDDCRFIETASIDRLNDVLNLMPKVGILSPLIKGCAGNAVQRLHEKTKWWKSQETVKLVWSPSPVCFPCVYLRYEIIDHIGLLDENIVGYGVDDVEYCTRARNFGWWTAVTSCVAVQHGDGSSALGDGRGRSWSTSFVRTNKNF